MTITAANTAAAPNIKEEFIGLLRDSVLIQGLLTCMVVGTWLYMIIAGRQPTDLLTQAAVLLIGFYFGGKFVQLTARVQTTAAKMLTATQAAQYPALPMGYSYKAVADSPCTGPVYITENHDPPAPIGAYQTEQ